MPASKFQLWIDGRNPIVYTDHKAIVSGLGKQDEPATLQRRLKLMEVAQWAAGCAHLAGVLNPVADALSRSLGADIMEAKASQEVVSNFDAISVAVQTLDYAAWAAAQQEDEAVQSFLQQVARHRQPSAAHLQRVEVAQGVSLWCDVGQHGEKRRILVPSTWRKKVFELVHNVDHPGRKLSQEKVAALYFWPHMNKEVAAWAKQCVACSINKVSRHIKLPPGQFAVPARRFINVHLDLVGPLPASNGGYKYLLTMVDRTTRLLKAALLADMTADTVAAAFLHYWVARYGVPSEITSDNGGPVHGGAHENCTATHRGIC